MGAAKLFPREMDSLEALVAVPKADTRTRVLHAFCEAVFDVCARPDRLRKARNAPYTYSQRTHPLSVSGPILRGCTPASTMPLRK